MNDRRKYDNNIIANLIQDNLFSFPLGKEISWMEMLKHASYSTR